MLYNGHSRGLIVFLSERSIKLPGNSISVFEEPTLTPQERSRESFKACLQQDVFVFA